MSTVSVIIPAYNQCRYLGEAIQSVLEQTHTDFEIVVVDDGSTDDTAQVVREFTDRRIRYLHQENRGLSAARNTGIRNSTGSYLSFLDSDDLFLAEKLTLLLSRMETDPEIGLAAGQAIPIDESGNRVGKTFDKPLPEDSAQLLLGNPLHVGSVLLRRDWQEKIGFFDESLRSYEDWDMWLRLARAGCRMGWVAQPVSIYRFHTAQMTRIGSQMTTATFAVLDKTFAEPGLPESWSQLHDQAYSRAHLRAAAQAYHAGDVTNAKMNLDQAIRFDPSLLEDHASRLANQFVGWTDLPKSADRLGYLERIYHNLPPSLDVLSRRRNHDLGQAAIQIAFDAYQRGDLPTANSAMRRAFRYQPRWLFNRGALSIFYKSFRRPVNK